MPLHLSVSAPGLSPAALSRLRRRALRMLRAASLSSTSPRIPEDAELGVTLVDDAAIRALNRDYRHQDRPTDVLSFAMREGEDGDVAPSLLGDVVISLPTARRQARRRGLEEEILFLLAHGFCHLLGYDHGTDREEATMNARANALLAEAARRGPVRAA